MNYETVIGLEVHVQLGTRTKLFCGCPLDSYDERGNPLPPNTNICPVCTGQPGVLPVLNELALKLLVRAGLSMGCRVAPHSVFARKNYFYPDLPKNYQISQYELPLCTGGSLDIEIPEEKPAAGQAAKFRRKKIGITRIHMEEDAGKLLHDLGAAKLDCSLVDYNRTGAPLAEIVSEPDMRTPEEAFAYLTALKALLQCIGISECNMERGELRCDANISIRPPGRKEFGVKIELKNLNSFKAVREALAYEEKRQAEVVDGGGRLTQATLLWNDAAGRTEEMRSKEEAHDYRYFPEPDLVPLRLDKKWVEEISAKMPELPAARRSRFMEKLGLPDYDARVLTAERALADYYETVLDAMAGMSGAKPIPAKFGSKPFADPSGPDVTPAQAKSAANWVMSELLGCLNAKKLSISESPVSAARMAELVGLIENGTLSGKLAKDVFVEMFESGKSAPEIVKAKGLVQVTDTGEIDKFIEQACAESEKVVADLRAGKKEALGALVGAVMKKSRGRANPKLVNELLKKKFSLT